MMLGGRNVRAVSDCAMGIAEGVVEFGTLF